MKVDVRTLGTVAITLAGERRLGLIAHPDAFTLLVLLALEGPIERDELRRLATHRSGAADDYADRAAEAALAEALEAIEAALGPAATSEADGRVRLAADLDLSIDAARFDAAIRRGDRAAAAREYRGKFLAGLPSPSLSGLRLWAETTRERLAAAYQAADAYGARTREAAHPAPTGSMRSFGELSDPPRGRLERFMDRVRRRMTYQVAAIYLMTAWVALQLVGLLVENNVLAEFWFTGSLVVAIMGFPLAVILAWARDETGVSIGDFPDARGPWPRWVRRTRTGHLLAAMGAVFVILVATIVIVREILPEPASPPAMAAPSSLAVLYFDVYSPGQALEPVADGFTSDLIEQLHAVPALDVRSLGAVRPYRDGSVPIDSLFDLLGVGAIVEGGLTQAGDSLRASVRLIAATDSTPEVLAAASRTGTMGSELALGADLAMEVARLLREELGVEIRLRELRRQTDSDEAWVLVHRALKLREQAAGLAGTNKTAAVSMISAADSLLVLAEEEDPEWLEPVVERGWNAASRALVETELPGNYDEAWAREALRFANRAVEMAPEDPRATELRGRVLFGLAEVVSNPEAEELMLRARRDLLASLSADPNRPRAAWALSRLYRRQGDHEQAARYAGAALEADFYFDEAEEVMWQLYSVADDLRQPANATRYCDQGRRRWPDGGRWYLCAMSLLKSYGADTADLSRAWALQDSMMQVVPVPQRDVIRRYSIVLLSGVAAKAGMADSARALIARSRQPEPEPFFYHDEAHAWMLLGEPDSALDRLATYLAHRPAVREAIRVDWWFEELFDSPRFQQITAGGDL